MATTTFTFSDGNSISVIAMAESEASLVSRVGEDVEFNNGRIHPADEYDILETARSMGETFAAQIKTLVLKLRDTKALDVIPG